MLSAPQRKRLTQPAATCGGKNLKNYKLTGQDRPGPGVAVVGEDDDVMLIESAACSSNLADINIYKRDTQGVILMRLEEGSRVISRRAGRQRGQEP